MCGEKNGMPVDNVIDLGSPPHVRGKVHFVAQSAVLAGITPACAGKSDLNHMTYQP